MKTKRSADADGNVHPKRQKIETASTRTTVAETEMHEIGSSRDLQLLLTFDQDIGPVPRQSKIHEEFPFVRKEESLIMIQKSSLSDHFWHQSPMLRKVMIHPPGVDCSLPTYNLRLPLRAKRPPLFSETSSKPGILQLNQTPIVSFLQWLLCSLCSSRQLPAS